MRRLARWPAAATAGAAIVGLAVGIVLAIDWSSGGSAATGSPATLPTCGLSPVSNGPHAQSVRATLKVPTVGRSGRRILGQIELSSPTGAAITLQTGQPSTLFVLYGGKVVGQYYGTTLGTGAFARIGPQTKDFPAWVLLSGCTTKTDPNPVQPDSGRRPLPPGHYQLVGTLPDIAPGFSADAVLATPPEDITVTA